MADTPKFCSFCGAGIEAADKFCAKCGKPVGQPAAAITQQAQPLPPPPASPPPATGEPGPSAAAALHEAQTTDSEQPAQQPVNADPPEDQQPGRRRKTCWCCLVVILLAVAGLVAYQFLPIEDWFGDLAIAPAGSSSNTVTALAFSVEGDSSAGPVHHMLVAGTEAGDLHVFDAETGSKLDTFANPGTGTGPIATLSCGPMERYNENIGQANYYHEYIAFTQGNAAFVLHFDMSQPAGQWQIKLDRVSAEWLAGPLVDVYYDSYSNYLSAMDLSDQTVRVWDMATLDLIAEEPRPLELGRIRQIQRSTNGRYTALEYMSGDIEVFDGWEADGGMTDYGLQVFEAINNYGSTTSMALAVSSLSWFGSMAGSSGLWEIDLIDMLEPDKVIRIPIEDEMTALAFSYHGDLLAAGGPGTLAVWDARSQEQLYQVKLP